MFHKGYTMVDQLVFNVGRQLRNLTGENSGYHCGS